MGFFPPDIRIALQYFLEEEQRKRQIYFNINELKRNTTTAKEMRIRGLIPLYKAGVIFHRKSDVELERELLQFPRGKHDDRADALDSQLEAQEPTRKKKAYKQAPFVPGKYDGTLEPQKPRKAQDPYMLDI